MTVAELISVLEEIDDKKQNIVLGLSYHYSSDMEYVLAAPSVYQAIVTINNETYNAVVIDSELL